MVKQLQHRVYYINGVRASYEDYTRLLADTQDRATNPIKALIIHGDNYDIITY